MSKTKSGDATRIGALLSWLGRREEEMAALLAELVAIPTENPPGKNYRACAELLENRLRQCGLECERLEAGDSKEATGDRPVCLIAN
jgi:acetylornithine deacetylase/succinyl-diaminopimelate desuccinylase-like protein